MKLLETIRFQNGKFDNLIYHQERMNKSRKELFGCEDEIDLADELTRHQTPRMELKVNAHKTNSSSSGFAIRMQYDADLQSAKCRIIYSTQIEEIEFLPHQLPEINSLKIVHNNKIDYSHKFLDRSQLNKLYQQKADCDDILIVKKGFVTDTWFANILFFDGKNWLTPEKPLLKGTQRQYLLDQKKIVPTEIRLKDLMNFKKARLINAMIRFEDAVDIDIQNIN